MRPPRTSPRIARTFAFLTSLAAFSCHAGTDATSPSIRDQSAVSVQTVVGDGETGQRVTLSLRWTGSADLAALQGRLAWDASKLRYVGQIPSAGTIVAAGPDGVGAVEIAALNVRGLPGDAAVLTFEVIAPDFARSLRFEPTIAATRTGERLTVRSEGAAAGVGLQSAALGRSMDWQSWEAVLGVSSAPGGPLRLPGSGRTFGDATLDGAINVLDALATSLRSVGLEDVIVGTDAPDQDLVVAANVSPFNLPGMGEAGDVCAPGINICGTAARTIDVLDALFISLESVGMDQPVVGEAIPRETAIGSRVLTGPLGSARTLSPDTTYQIQGTLSIDAGGSLVVPPGTRIEAAPGALIVVGREGRIDARGTHLDPVLFTCAGGAEVRGCWSGLVLAGNAPLNRGSETSPPAPGNGVAGCRELEEDPRVGAFGGCDPNDDRGVLTHVRVEFASRGLEVLGVGRGTVIDQIQVHGAEGTGMTIAGGTVDLRRVLVTAPRGDGISWRDGWVGRAQHLIVQLGPVTGASGLVGRNALGNPSATPISRPVIYNATVVGVDFPPGGAALMLSGGTGAIVRNLVGVGLPDPNAGLPNGIDIDGPETCARIGTDLVVETSVFAGIPFPGDPDVDAGCAGSPAVEAGIIASGGSLVVTGQAEIATLIKAATDPYLPDFRGTHTGALAGFTASAPPADGFFDPTAVYPGGSEIATAARPNIPWYAGWTRGGVGVSAPFGRIAGTVMDGAAPLAGIAVTAGASDAGDYTDEAGAYFMAFVHPGSTSLSLSGLPSECVDPGALPVTVLPNSTTILNVTLLCGVADLAIEKTGPPSAGLGDTITYVISTTNQGPSGAEDVVVVDDLPSGLTYLGANRSATEAGGVVTWPPIDLGVGATRVDSVRAIVAASTGTGVNIASATSASPDPDPSNNDGSDSQSRVATLFESEADLEAAISGPAAATVGDTLLYVITTTNHGPDDAAAVAVRDSLPSGFTYLWATRGAVGAGPMVTWPATSLSDGSFVVDSVFVVATSAGPRVSAVVASAETPDPNSANQVDSLSTSVGALASGLVWEQEFADGAVVSAVDIGPVGVLMTGIDPNGIGLADNFRVEYESLGTHPGFWEVNIDATSRTQRVQFTMEFSQSVDSLRFTLLDVDRRSSSPQFHDSVSVTGWNGMTSVDPVVVSIGSEVHQSSPGRFAGETEVTGSTAANVALLFQQPVDSVTFDYGPGPLSPTNPAQETIGISDLTWSILAISSSQRVLVPGPPAGHPPQPAPAPPEVVDN